VIVKAQQGFDPRASFALALCISKHVQKWLLWKKKAKAVQAVEIKVVEEVREEKKKKKKNKAKREEQKKMKMQRVYCYDSQQHMHQQRHQSCLAWIR